MKAFVTDPMQNLLSELTILFAEKSSIPKPRDQVSLPKMKIMKKLKSHDEIGLLYGFIYIE